MEAWVSLLVQVPLVGVFIWYSLELQKRNQASQEKRDTAYLSAMAAITSTMEKHELDFKQAVARMEERTRPRNAHKDDPNG